MVKPLFDPQQLPVDAVAGEPALHPERLLPDWLRGRFLAPPVEWEQEVPEGNISGRAVPTPAAVLIPLVARPEGLAVLLTQRTADLSSHPGQISFPGGRAEESDDGPVDTALRETEEEIGLARARVEILGTLPDYLTGTGYLVTPVVGLVAPPFELVAEPGEVAEVFEVPLSFLMDGQNHLRQSFILPASGVRRRFYAMPYGRYYIWGVTAGILRNLFHFLRV
ncbi:CoA pyrophosphatase [Oxalobacteraceae bacterium A2-2]